MLVKAKNDITDFGPIKRVTKGKEYLVIAIELVNGNEYYYVLPKNNINLEHVDSVNDPLWFKSSNFEVIDPSKPDDWITKQVNSSSQTIITSFPEWFENGFNWRAHDWDLNSGDYIILNKYLKMYIK